MDLFSFESDEKLKISGKFLNFPKFLNDNRADIHDLMLIHAFPFDSEMFMDNFKDKVFIKRVKKLTSEVRPIRIFLPDLPGFGASDSFHSKPMDLLPYVDCIHNLVDHFKIKNLIIGGCSMGGYIALEYVRQYPDIIEGLILIDTKPDPDTDEQKNNRYKTIDNFETSLMKLSEKELSQITLKDIYSQNEQVKVFMDDLYRKIVSKQTLLKNTVRAEYIFDLMKKQKPVGIIHALNAMAGRLDTSKILKSFTKSILIIMGEFDMITPIEIGKKMKADKSNSLLEIIPSAGHLSNVENPLRFNNILVNWLEKIY